MSYSSSSSEQFRIKISPSINRFDWQSSASKIRPKSFSERENLLDFERFAKRINYLLFTGQQLQLQSMAILYGSANLGGDKFENEQVNRVRLAVA